MCAFAARVALVRDVQITLFTTPAVYKRVVEEVGRGFSSKDADRQKLIRYVISRLLNTAGLLLIIR